jgi:hypothetical protein
VLRAGGALAVLNALRLHSTACSVQTQGWAALECMSTCPQGAKVVLGVGGVEEAMEAMDRHGSEAALVVHCLGLLRLVAMTGEGFGVGGWGLGFGGRGFGNWGSQPPGPIA